MGVQPPETRFTPLPGRVSRVIDKYLMFSTGYRIAVVPSGMRQGNIPKFVLYAIYLPSDPIGSFILLKNSDLQYIPTKGVDTVGMIVYNSGNPQGGSK